MPQLDRFTVSLDTELLAAFDTYLTARGYQNRSEAVRDLIRDLLLVNRLDNQLGEVTAILSLICHVRTADAGRRLRAVLLDDSDRIAGNLQKPIDDERDACVIILNGPAEQVQATADRIQALRGVTQVQMNVISQSSVDAHQGTP